MKNHTTPCLYPWPKSQIELPGRFDMKTNEGVQYPPGAGNSFARFRAEMRAEFGISLKPSASGRIIIAPDRRVPDEGYRLEVRPDFMRLGYRDQRGLLYGLDTLLSLTTRTGQGSYIQATTIEDEPYKSIRGIHLYIPGRDNIPFFKRLLRYLARLRLNTVFLEIGAGMEFRRHPEINSAWEKLTRFTGPFNSGAQQRVQWSQGYSKDSVHPEVGGGSFLAQGEARGLAAEAAQYGIEIVPEVQSLSHAYWLCMPHPEIAERGEDPFPDTYCPSNPASYKLLFDALDEVIDVFRPRMVHIGHDEWYSIGLCPKCRKKTGAELFLSDVNKITCYLKSRGIQACAWGDKILNFKGDDGKRYGGIYIRRMNPKTGFMEIRRPTHAAIRRFPRDILIAHWYYSLSRAIDRTLVRNGLKFIYGNFYPTIFQDWSGRSSAPLCLGGEMSTWVDVSELVFAATGQLPMLALGANMLWSHRTDKSAPLPAHIRLGAIDSGEGKARALGGGSPAYQALGAALPALRRYIHGRLLPSECPAARAAPLKLDACCNLKKTDCLGGIAFDARAALAGFRQAGLKSGGVSFSLPSGSKSAIGIEFNSRCRFVIPVGGKAKSLVFLHALLARDMPAASYSKQNWEAHTAAVYRAVYADRCFVDQPVITAHSIGLFKSPFGVEQLARTFPAFPAWTDGRRTLYAYEWVNPHPDKTIARLVIEGSGASGARYILSGAGSKSCRGGVVIFAISRII